MLNMIKILFLYLHKKMFIQQKLDSWLYIILLQKDWGKNRNMKRRKPKQKNVHQNSQKCWKKNLGNLPFFKKN